MGDANGGDASLGQWARRKEARRNMYATSTEQVRVHRRGMGNSSLVASSSAAMCQKCLRVGHWTYECKNEAVYVQRPSRSQQLKNPKLRQPFNQDKPPELQEEEEQMSVMEKRKKLKYKIKEKVKDKKKTKSPQRKRHRSVSSSDSSSSTSDSSDSSGSSSSSSSDSSSSDSESTSSSSDSGRSSRLKRQRKD